MHWGGREEKVTQPGGAEDGEDVWEERGRVEGRGAGAREERGECEKLRCRRHCVDGVRHCGADFSGFAAAQRLMFFAAFRDVSMLHVKVGVVCACND